jgi:gluconokinase
LVIIIVMGVSGCGKSTVGQLIADSLGCLFRDGDGFHPAANVAKMKAGTPLNDEDRRPWLLAIQQFMRETHASGQDAVVACSALKESYRDLLLRAEPWVRFVHLTGPREVIEERMKARAGHFMPVTLLDSQLATLETPKDAWAEDIRRTPAEIATSVVARIRSGQPG